MRVALLNPYIAESNALLIRRRSSQLMTPPALPSADVDCAVDELLLLLLLLGAIHSLLWKVISVFVYCSSVDMGLTRVSINTHIERTCGCLCVCLCVWLFLYMFSIRIGKWLASGGLHLQLQSSLFSSSSFVPGNNWIACLRRARMHAALFAILKGLT